MSQANQRQAQGRGSAPYQHLRPFEGMLTKIEELEDYSRRALVNFPKSERHLLSAEVRLCIERIERITLTAWKRYQKKTTLTDLDIEIEILRRKVRKAERYGYISGRQYRDWAEHISALGSILGGWLRHERAKQGYSK